MVENLIAELIAIRTRERERDQLLTEGKAM
jgi:hypothetical protein